MELNISKLRIEIERSKLTKVEIASQCGVDRKTIENVLNGRDPKLSTITSLAKVLGKPIGYFFDEEATVNIRQAGRDYAEHGSIHHHAAAHAEEGLQAENEQLRRQLIEAQQRIIALLDNRTHPK